MHNFTPEDLIAFFYGEMNQQQTALLEKELAQNWVLQKKISVIEEAADRLDRSIESPSERCIAAIMSYAKQSQVVNSH